MKIRSSGVLLHISSLPSKFGIGDLGPGAYEFVDFLARTKQSFWQILPLNPTESLHFHSPYHSTSAFGFNPLLISPELLVEQGLLTQKDLRDAPGFPPDRVDYAGVLKYKGMLFDKAHARFKQNLQDPGFEEFCWQNAYWLDDFALFTVLQSKFSVASWNQWWKPLRNRDLTALRKTSGKLSHAINQEKFLQYICFRQWIALKSQCNEKGIRIIGDLPIYVQYNSVDVWTYPRYFKLDDNRRPVGVAGVPPDYFSETGQLWGNPIYRWDVLKSNGYDWWMKRMAHNLQLFDYLRIDHFRGLISYWEVPAGEKDAKGGKWVEGPSEDFLKTALRRFPHAPFIVEDLGYITPDVRDILHRFRLPGMRVLIFGFGSDQPRSPHAPHNLIQDCVVYTGTHDNNTVKGWFETEAAAQDKKRLMRYLGRRITRDRVSLELIRLAMSSVANTAIIPMQDILGLGAEARMNTPATRKGNWQWRLLSAGMTAEVRERLLELTEICGRT